MRCMSFCILMTNARHPGAINWHQQHLSSMAYKPCLQVATHYSYTDMENNWKGHSCIFAWETSSEPPDNRVFIYFYVKHVMCVLAVMAFDCDVANFNMLYERWLLQISKLCHNMQYRWHEGLDTNSRFWVIFIFCLRKIWPRICFYRVHWVVRAM